MLFPFGHIEGCALWGVVEGKMVTNREESDWYDEIRYDSHDRRRGRKVLAPHFHMKIRCTFKADADGAV